MVAQRTGDYELALILSPEATEEDITATLERVGSFITDRGGNVGEHGILGMRRLAYPILKFMEGNYVVTRFSLDRGSVSEFQRTLNASEDILRHLVIKV